MLAWVFAVDLARSSRSRARYSLSIQPTWSFEFAKSFAYHWFLPFSALFLVAFGGWAIGMRNMIIYELEADYSNYLAALGAPTRLVRRYAYRNALLPQITGLALALGAVVAGAIVVEIVFSYPGLGTLTLQAIQNRDYFLIQGIFLFLIIGVLIANFVIDIAYVFIDPRTRIGMQGRRVMAVSKRTRRPASAAARRPIGVRRRAGHAPRERPAPRQPRSDAAPSSSTSRCATGSSSSVSPSSCASSPSASSARCSPPHKPLDFSGPTGSRRRRTTGSGRRRTARTSSPSSSTACGRPSWSERVGGGIAWLIGAVVGFTAGYRGGLVDDVLNMLTNVVLVIPTLAILIIVAAYLTSRATRRRRC